jgi:uncharacterized protein
MPREPRASTTANFRAVRRFTVPVRSLNSVVLKWPSRDDVLASARQWAVELTRRDEAVEEVFCVGSCARGDWGVGSDIDIVVLVTSAPDSPVERRCLYEPTDLPVPADLWVYSHEEWAALVQNAPHLGRRLLSERLVLADRAGT